MYRQGAKTQRTFIREDVRPREHAAAAVQLVPVDKFKEQVAGLRRSTTINNDKGDEVAFHGESKENFIRLFTEGYPVAGKLLEAVYDTGRLLYEVREILKPKGLFLTWMEMTGFRGRRYYRYIRVYGRFGDALARFSHLGIRKLEAASKLENCVEYLERNAGDAEKQTVMEFEQTIRNLRARKKKGSRGKQPKFEEIAGCKVRRSEDGKRIEVDGLSKKKQRELFAAIKDVLSKAKRSTCHGDKSESDGQSRCND